MRQRVWLAALVVGVLETGACRSPYQEARAGSPDAVITTLPRHDVRSKESEMLLPPHRRLLEEIGWLGYVQSHVDAIEYYAWPAFQSSKGPATGLADWTDGRRIARVAMSDRRTEDIVATIVHEAAHLSGVSQVGTVYGEDMAHAVEQRFLNDLRTFERRQRDRSSQEWGERW